MQPVRVVVKLPYNRPKDSAPDPPKIEWTSEKADILWKLIEIQRTRAVDSAGANWKGLAAHLGVPLPYLLYRVNARFQEEIRGLKDIQGALGPASPPPQFFSPNETQVSSPKITTLDVRARLNSLTNTSPLRHKNKNSSSITTLQGVSTKKVFEALKRSVTPTSSAEEIDSSDEEAIKEEEADRIAEEEQALTRKLAQLQKMMTNEKLGFVKGPTRQRGEKLKDRGRPTLPSGKSPLDGPPSASTSQSISSAGSSHGSMPDLPSPPGNVAVTKPSSTNAPSPHTASGRHPLGQHVHTRRRSIADPASDLSSLEASSFSDLSDASISVSALEDAIMSNFGSNNSNISHFTRSRLSNRAQRSIPQ